MRELTIEDVKRFVSLHTNYPIQFNQGFYYYDDDNALETFLITFNILEYPTSENILETFVANLVDVWEWKNKSI